MTTDVFSQMIGVIAKLLQTQFKVPFSSVDGCVKSGQSWSLFSPLTILHIDEIFCLFASVSCVCIYTHLPASICSSYCEQIHAYHRCEAHAGRAHTRVRAHTSTMTITPCYDYNYFPCAFTEGKTHSHCNTEWCSWLFLKELWLCSFLHSPLLPFRKAKPHKITNITK